MTEESVRSQLRDLLAPLSHHLQMSSGIVISESSSWMVAGWVGRAVIEEIQTALGADHPALVAELEQGSLYPGALAELTSLSEADMRKLNGAAQAAFRNAKARGPEGWNDAEAFPSFLRAFQRLLDSLDGDPRIKEA